MVLPVDRWMASNLHPYPCVGDMLEAQHQSIEVISANASNSHCSDNTQARIGWEHRWWYQKRNRLDNNHKYYISKLRYINICVTGRQCQAICLHMLNASLSGVLSLLKQCQASITRDWVGVCLFSGFSMLIMSASQRHECRTWTVVLSFSSHLEAPILSGHK